MHSPIQSLLLVYLEPLASKSTFLCLAHCHKVCAFVEGSLIVKAGPFSGGNQNGNDPQLGFQFILVIGLLVTNAVATIMILYKTWYYILIFLHIALKLTSIRIYHTQIKAHFQSQNKSTQVEQVLLLLVESGFGYILIWVCSAFPLLLSMNWTFLIIGAALVHYDNKIMSTHTFIDHKWCHAPHICESTSLYLLLQVNFDSRPSILSWWYLLWSIRNQANTLCKITYPIQSILGRPSNISILLLGYQSLKLSGPRWWKAVMMKSLSCIPVSLK